MTPRLRAAILNVKKLSSIHPHRTDLWIVEREAFEELLAAFDESERCECERFKRELQIDNVSCNVCEAK